MHAVVASTSRPLAPLSVDTRSMPRIPSPDELINVNQKKVLNEVEQGLRELLRSKKSSSAPSGVLKVKLEYMGDRFVFEMKKPVRLEALQVALRNKFEHALHMYYAPGSAEVLVSITTQAHLDQAINVVEKTGRHCLKITLSKHAGKMPSEVHLGVPDPSGTYSANIVEVSYPETCPSCKLSRSIGGSTCSSGVHMDDWRLGLSASSPRAPLHWKEGQRIGAGAYGSVYRAYDVDNSRDLVVKKVPIVADNREASRDAQSLEYDVRVLGQLQHPRIVQYLGVQKSADGMLIFMEYMPGGSIKDTIKQYGPFKDKAARKTTYQVLDGLAFLHRNNIVHRDIKTGNILRDTQGNVKIGDFGSSKKLQALATHNGEFQGTIHYTAPEVLIGKTAYGRKADVWSVGVTLIEMLAGKVPWSNLEPMEAMFKIAYEEAKTDEIPEETDPQLVDLTKTLMTKDPQSRPMASDLMREHAAFADIRIPALSR